MGTLHDHPRALTLVALVLAAAAVAAIAGAYGFGSFVDAWSHLRWGWLWVSIGGAVLAGLAYAVPYRALTRFNGGPRLAPGLLMRLVALGFGSFAPDGGFAVDKRVLHAVAGDRDAATVRVFGLGALEWALLAPAACVTALILLLTGDKRPMSSLLWPWVLAVPVGFAVGLWLAAPARRHRLGDRGRGWRGVLGRAARGVDMLRSLARGLPGCWDAWAGMALYWSFDIAAFYGAARFIGLRADVGEVILAYATGYALTRRSMPLAGAGVTETLMTFALHWVGEPVAPALAAVVVYRIFNFVLPALPALLIHPRIDPLMSAADHGRAPTQSERRHAGAS